MWWSSAARRDARKIRASDAGRQRPPARAADGTGCAARPFLRTSSRIRRRARRRPRTDAAKNSPARRAPTRDIQRAHARRQPLGDQMRTAACAPASAAIIIGGAGGRHDGGLRRSRARPTSGMPTWRPTTADDFDQHHGEQRGRRADIEQHTAPRLRGFTGSMRIRPVHSSVDGRQARWRGDHPRCTAR